VIDLRTIAPLDMQTVTASARKTGRVVVAHEAQVDFGVGAEIAARHAQGPLRHAEGPGRARRRGASPVPFSKPLETEFVPTQNRILAAIRETLN